jgi:ring-1,2-phenylacetyl-CoA epoxidase subunit PaaC
MAAEEDTPQKKGAHRGDMVSPVLSERVKRLLQIADDELVLGWRDSEWTGIAPSLEEDVAFSSIAQNEIGHARALYELAARELGTTADELAFDRQPEEYLSAPLVELRRLEWARTVARHYLYETADAVRIEALAASDDPEVAGLAMKIAREEVYHLMHAELWIDRLLATDEGRARLQEATEELWPYALGVLDDELRPLWVERVRARLGFDLPDVEPITREHHTEELRELWEQMTSVRRSIAAGSEW